MPLVSMIFIDSNLYEAMYASIIFFLILLAKMLFSEAALFVICSFNTYLFWNKGDGGPFDGLFLLCFRPQSLSILWKKFWNYVTFS